MTIGAPVIFGTILTFAGMFISGYVLGYSDRKRETKQPSKE